MYKDNRGKTLGELLDTFETLRLENIETLGGMNAPREQLERRGTHPELWTITLGALLAFQYDGAVGAWHPYISILKR